VGLADNNQLEKIEKPRRRLYIPSDALQNKSEQG
jgi:hypothetical protein